MRPIDTIDIEEVQVLPRLRRLRGPARVEVRARLRNLTGKRRGRGARADASAASASR